MSKACGVCSSDVSLLEEYTTSGTSPFLTPTSRGWGKNLSLKVAFLAAFCLILSFFFTLSPRWHEAGNLFLLFTFFLAGVPALISATQDLAKWEINIDVLMSLAAFVSIFIGSGREGGLLLVLFSFSAAMEAGVRSKARGAISHLQKLSPTKGYVVRDDGSLIERSLADIHAGEVLLVKAGQIVPLDGEVVKGCSSVNMVHLTGENLPITKKVGDTLPAGAHNRDGSLMIRVTHTSAHSTLNRIVQLICEAEKAKPKLARWLDKVTSRYAACIIALTFCFALFFPLIFPIGYLGAKGSIYRACAFLIAASPCALILAIPIAYLSAISACAKKGIILKGGVVLDRLVSADVMALDKTGTLTTGELTCSSIWGGCDELIAIAYALEQNADHPIARALCSYAQERKISPAKIENFRAIFGKGVRAEVEGEEVLLGNMALVEEKLSLELKKQVEEIQEKGEAYALLIKGSRCVLFCFQDEIRPKTKETIAGLKRRLSLLMLSGDHESAARHVAQSIGLQEYYAALTPEEKLTRVTEIAKKKNLIMVGDGINDAPALARAHVGISMGKRGSTTAIDVSDIVLMQDRFDHLLWLLDKAKLTSCIVKQNLCLAACAICVAIVPALLGWIPLWLAVVLHEGGTVVVGLNALRLLRK